MTVPVLINHSLFNVTVPVADIKAVVTGKDCPHMKEKGALKQNKVSPLVCAWQWRAKMLLNIKRSNFPLMRWWAA